MARPCTFIWDDEKIEILKKYYPSRQYDILFEKLGFSIDVIRQKASQLKIRTENYRYTKKEISFIKENYGKMSCEEMGEILGRTVASVAKKITFLGLAKSKEWTDEDFALLKEKYPHYSNKYLSKKIFPGRSKEAIRTMALKLGLHKTEEKGLHFFDKDEMIEDLINLSKKINRTPSLEELAIYGLPSEISYRRYFGSYRKACLLAGLKINESLYGRARIYISSAGDICHSNSERIVTEFFIENKINYVKEVMYSHICNDARCGTKRSDWVIDGKYVVEYWGYPKIESYEIKKDIKISICKDNNIELIQISRKDLTNLHIIFSQFL